ADRLLTRAVLKKHPRASASDCAHDRSLAVARGASSSKAGLTDRLAYNASRHIIPIGFYLCYRNDN
ncbi:MAG: hypothetical protein ACREAB_16650, partial [Blastocatellia bacterium]